MTADIRQWGEYKELQPWCTRVLQGTYIFDHATCHTVEWPCHEASEHIVWLDWCMLVQSCSESKYLPAWSRTMSSPSLHLSLPCPMSLEQSGYTGCHSSRRCICSYDLFTGCTRTLCGHVAPQTEEVGSRRRSEHGCLALMRGGLLWRLCYHLIWVTRLILQATYSLQLLKFNMSLSVENWKLVKYELARGRLGQCGG